MDLSPRAVIAGRYRVDQKVGAGGMGEVWSGEHIAVGVRVAIKTLLPAAAINHEVVARFKREAYLLGRIRSDYVARVVDFVADDVYGLVLVMEYVDGEPLSKVLQDKPMTIEETIDLAFDIASSLTDLHKASIIHRDLKPGNIILHPLKDGKRRAVVVDFGVSRVMNSADRDEDEELTGITRADMAVGTIEYMAPEQILNSRNVTPGSDIYAAGAILFRALAGRHVYGNITSDAELAQKKLTTEAPPVPITRTDEVAVALARVVSRAVKRRPSERYKSAEEMLVDLLPLREMARVASLVDESTTRDGKDDDLDMATIALMPGAPLPSPTHPAVRGATGQPATAGPQPDAQPPVAAPPPVAAAPSSADSSVSVAAFQPPPPAPRRGVPLVVTIGAVALALVGGVVLGPQLMRPEPDAIAPPPSASVAPAAPPPSATASAAVTAAPSASAAPGPSASASASAAAGGSASAPVAADSAPKPAAVPAKPASSGGAAAVPAPKPKADPVPKPEPMKPDL